MQQKDPAQSGDSDAGSKHLPNQLVAKETQIGHEFSKNRSATERC